MRPYISIIILLFLSCSSNKQSQFGKSNCDFDNKISENEKILKIQNLTDGDLNNDSLQIIFAINSEDYTKYIINKTNNITNRINYNKVSLKAINSYSFFEKGNFNIGNEYIYNEQGQVIQTINHNQYNKYPICYKEIIKSTIKKAGRKFYFQGLERDSLIKNNETEYSWKVYFEDSISKSPTLSHKFFRINAKTGKTITEKIVN